MKFIDKNTEPDEVIDWKNLATDDFPDWVPLFDNLPKDEKIALKKSLLTEQGYICGYCQRRINLDNKTILEHVKPQNTCTDEEALEYSNIIASCNGNQDSSNKEISKKGRHCDAHKKNTPIAISPLMANCEESFIYSEEGNIFGDTQDAITTIKTLNLDVLSKDRKAYLSGIIYEDESLGLLISNDDMLQLIERYKLKYMKEGFLKYEPFTQIVCKVLSSLSR